jgi:hypothetical protein
MAGCEGFQVRAIEASGGLIRPVMLKVTLDASPEFPLPVTERVFRSLHANLAFSDSLLGLATGRWAFNPFNTYSSQTYGLQPVLSRLGSSTGRDVQSTAWRQRKASKMEKAKPAPSRGRDPQRSGTPTLERKAEHEAVRGPG